MQAPSTLPSLRHGEAILSRHDVRRKFGTVADVRSWHPTGTWSFGVRVRGLGRGAGKPGPGQDRGPALCIGLRNLPQVAAKSFQYKSFQHKSFQHPMVFRARKLPARALYVQPRIGRHSRRLPERTGECLGGLPAWSSRQAYRSDAPRRVENERIWGGDSKAAGGHTGRKAIESPLSALRCCVHCTDRCSAAIALVKEVQLSEHSAASVTGHFSHDRPLFLSRAVRRRRQ